MFVSFSVDIYRNSVDIKCNTKGKETEIIQRFISKRMPDATVERKVKQERQQSQAVAVPSTNTMTVHTGHDAVVESEEMSQGSETKPTPRRAGEWPTLETKPYIETKSVRLYQGDCLELLNQMRSGDPERDDQFDAMITDPPYCSGTALYSQNNYFESLTIDQTTFSASCCGATQTHCV